MWGRADKRATRGDVAHGEESLAIDEDELGDRKVGRDPILRPPVGRTRHLGGEREGRGFEGELAPIRPAAANPTSHEPNKHEGLPQTPCVAGGRLCPKRSRLAQLTTVRLRHKQGAYGHHHAVDSTTCLRSTSSHAHSYNTTRPKC